MKCELQDLVLLPAAGPSHPVSHRTAIATPQLLGAPGSINFVNSFSNNGNTTHPAWSSSADWRPPTQPSDSNLVGLYPYPSNLGFHPPYQHFGENLGARPNCLAGSAGLTLPTFYDIGQSPTHLLENRLADANSYDVPGQYQTLESQPPYQTNEVHRRQLPHELTVTPEASLPSQGNSLQRSTLTSNGDLIDMNSYHLPSMAQTLVTLPPYQNVGDRLTGPSNDLPTTSEPAPRTQSLNMASASSPYTFFSEGCQYYPRSLETPPEDRSNWLRTDATSSAPQTHFLNKLPSRRSRAARASEVSQSRIHFPAFQKHPHPSEEIIDPTSPPRKKQKTRVFIDLTNDSDDIDQNTDPNTAPRTTLYHNMTQKSTRNPAGKTIKPEMSPTELGEGVTQPNEEGTSLPSSPPLDEFDHRLFRALHEYLHPEQSSGDSKGA